MAYRMSPMTIKRIIVKSKTIYGSESEEFNKTMGDHINATREYVANPTQSAREMLEEVTKMLPSNNLTDSLELMLESNDIVSTELVETIGLKLLQNNIVRTNARVHRNIVRNRKTIVISDKEGSYLQEVPLDSADFKNYIEVSDKSLIALGLAERFAPRGDINVNQSVDSVIKYQATLPFEDDDDNNIIDVEPQTGTD